MEIEPHIRIGLGHDTHRLVSGGPLRLGGMDIPHDAHLEGHSDGDVLLHAIADAALGAAGLPDIGELFPNSDPALKGCDSGEMLSEAMARVRALGYSPVSLDCVVFAEQPRIAAYKNALRARIAALVGLAPDRIGIKGKTGEGVGPIGRAEAIAAECVVLLWRRALG